MVNLTITLTIFIVIFVLLKRNLKRSNKILIRFRNEFKKINMAYLEVFFAKGKRISLNFFMIFLAEIFSLIYISIGICRYLNLGFEISSYFITRRIVIILLLVFIFIYYFVGYLLIASSNTSQIKNNIQTQTFKTDFVLSYFILSMYLFVMFIFPHEFNKTAPFSLIGIGISYYLNMKLLLKIMLEPIRNKSIDDDEGFIKKIGISSLLIFIIIIINLYLAVCIIYGMDQSSFTNANDYFSLFYYTIIAFTTIGYGDIVPTTIASRSVGIIIALTSVICLTIFLSSVFSYQTKK